MDLLGSILSSMDKPPELDDKRKEQLKSKFKISFFTFFFQNKENSFSFFFSFEFPLYFDRTKRAIGKTKGV